MARFGPNGSVVPLGDIPTNSSPDRQHHQSGILNAITESRLDGVAMIHFEGRHAPPPPTRARGADGSVGGAVQVEAVEQVVGVSVARGALELSLSSELLSEVPKGLHAAVL